MSNYLYGLGTLAMGSSFLAMVDQALPNGLWHYIDIALTAI